MRTEPEKALDLRASQQGGCRDISSTGLDDSCGSIQLWQSKIPLFLMSSSAISKYIKGCHVEKEVVHFKCISIRPC